MPVFKENWRAILRHAWSVRFVFIAAILSGAEVGLPLVVDRLPFDPWWLALMSFGVVCAAFIARFVAQEKLGAS